MNFARPESGLPKKNGEYLAKTPRGTMIIAYYSTFFDGMWWDSKDTMQPVKVSCWTYLPSVNIVSAKELY